jgi:predicted metalloprotease
VKFKRPRRLSQNIEDRRGASPRRVAGPAGALGGLGGLAVVVTLLLAMCGGGSGLPGSGLDLSAISEQLESVTGTGLGSGEPLDAPLDAASDPDRAEAELASVVLDNSQGFWSAMFAANNLTYRDATLVLFRGATTTGCGQGSASTGPFYCPLDEKIYIDLSFWDELESRFGATGDFAQAYVIAHEVAHHVQNVLGVSDDVRAAMSRRPSDQNALSVRQELQADCYSGVWANSVWTDGDVGDPTGIDISRSDIIEALEAAAAVGDDHIQEVTTGRVDPESWTHGSADQRTSWFNEGFETGNPAACDTFS